MNLREIQLDMNKGATIFHITLKILVGSFKYFILNSATEGHMIK